MGESTPMAGSHRRRAQRRQRCAAAPAPPQSPDPPQLLVPAVWEAEPRWQSGDLQLEHERVGPLRPVHRGNAAPLTSACTRHLGDWGAGARPAPCPAPLATIPGPTLAIRRAVEALPPLGVSAPGRMSWVSVGRLT